MSPNSYQAAHLENGNYFDDMRIDIAASFKTQDEWLLERQRWVKSVRRNILLNYADLAMLVLLRKLGMWEALVTSGVVRGWFDEFLVYWREVLNGRPLNLVDFHHLRFHYRTHIQHMDDLSWQDAAQHLANWQRPSNINYIFAFTIKYALQPFRYRGLPGLLKKGMRVLEYGCALAPMYRTYRRYLNHIPAQWVLADIPNFPFHFARHLYARDKEVAQFVTIAEDRFDDPLKDVEGPFDMIIIQEVFEHLDRPLAIAGYLVERLKPGGYLLFDYVKSEGVGLDTAAGVAERMEVLEYLNGRLEMIQGDFKVTEESVGLCVGRKK